MVTTIEPKDDLLLDTTFAIAITNPNDQYHQSAQRLVRDIRRVNARLTTTRAVILEIGNAFSRQRNRSDAVRFLNSLEHDPRVTLLPVTEEIYHRAFALFAARPDKEWGLVDCISFIVMTERGLTKALTADEHFEQAGFEALLRTESV